MQSAFFLQPLLFKTVNPGRGVFSVMCAGLVPHGATDPYGYHANIHSSFPYTSVEDAADLVTHQRLKTTRLEIRAAR